MSFYLPAKVWNMESLPKAETLNSFLSDKLLKNLKTWINIITVVHTITLLLSETIYHQHIKSSGAVFSLISMHICTFKGENIKVSFLEILLKLELAVKYFHNALPSIFTIKNVTQVVMPCWKQNIIIKGQFVPIEKYVFYRAAVIMNETSLPTYVPVILQLMYPHWDVSESSRRLYL